MKLRVTNAGPNYNTVPCQIHKTDTFPKPGTFAVCHTCSFMIIAIATERGTRKGVFWDTLEVSETNIASYVDPGKALIPDEVS